MEHSNTSRREYHVTLRGGLFYAHPLDVGGPFHSLGEAAAAIKCHSTWVSATQLLLSEDYYLTLKDGLFHIHPNDGIAGGPYKWLADATDAIRFDRSWRAEQKERARRAREFWDQLDPAECLANMKELIEAIRSGKRDPEPEPVNAVSSLESEECDPEISEVIDRMDRIAERRNAIRNGMKWMQSEVLEAFESYISTSTYQGPKYEFVKLDRQCLIYDTLSEPYHHYNFTMRKKSSFYLSKKAHRSLKRPSKRGWDYQLFFAEVKSAEEGKKSFAVHCSLTRMVIALGARMLALILDTQQVEDMRRAMKNLDFHLTATAGVMIEYEASLRTDTRNWLNLVTLKEKCNKI